MMSYVMGVSHERALNRAVDLGIAMQLTNIARDIKEDFERGRVYLPKDWLAYEGLSETAIFENPRALYRVTSRLLNEAEKYYVSSYKGLKYLSLRSAFAIAIASGVYAEIGRQMLRRGPEALQSRTVIPKSRKIFIAVREAIRLLPLAVSRIFQPWSRTEIQRAWIFRGVHS